jgi:hypothetical protein
MIDQMLEWSEKIPEAPAEPIVQLPEIISAGKFMAEVHEIPAELVHGLIHRGTLTMFAGGSKAAKTFTLMDLGLSVAEGRPFWGRETVPGRVLYVNFEIAAAFFQIRLQQLADAGGFVQPLQNFDIWNLRGFATDARDIVPKIIERCREANYSMIVIDPIYKLMAGRNENAAGEMAEFLNWFEKLSQETGAAVVYSHHFAKGLASGKEQLDRASGSGVFSRHADGIITMTGHEVVDAFVVEATLRNFRAPAPFVVRWEFPMMRIDSDLDPTKLKSKAGAKTLYTPEAVAEHLVDGMTDKEWKAAAQAALGLQGSTFNVKKAKALAQNIVKQEGKGFFRVPKVRSCNIMAGGESVREATPEEVKIRKACQEVDRKAAEKAERQAAGKAA